MSRYKVLTVIFWAIAFLFLIVSFMLGSGGYSNLWKAVIIGVWTVGVPFYFMIDFIFLHPVKDTKDSLELEKFKHAQELGLRFWLAVVGILGLLYFDEGKVVFHDGQPKVSCTSAHL